MYDTNSALYCPVNIVSGNGFVPVGAKQLTYVPKLTMT